MLPLRVFAFLLSVSLVACGPKGGTDVGNGATPELDLRGYEAQSPMTGTQALALKDGATIDSALMAIRRVRLRPGSDCEVDEEQTIDLDGPYFADLVGGGIMGAGAVIDTEAGSFCEVKFGYHKVSSADGAAPALLQDHSIRMDGISADGRSFTVLSEINDDVEIKAKDGSFTVAPGGTRLFIAFELGSWIEALELSTLDGDPITVDNDTNPDALSAFEEAVKDSADLFRDDDGDDELSKDEHAAGEELND